MCNLRIKISSPCYAQPYLLFRAIYCNVSSSQLILRDPELLLLLYLQNLARLKVAGSAAMNFKLAYVYQTPVTQSRKGPHAYFIAHHLLRSV